MKAVLFALLLFLAACQEPVRETPPLLMDTTLAFPAQPDSLSPLAANQSIPSTAPLADSEAILPLRDSIPLFARQYLGAPYIYATSDPQKGFDCSGFIYYVYHYFGIAVPRSSIDYKTYGREVPLALAQTADLILFTGVQDTDRIGHIGIILQNKGDSTEFIHASSGKEMAVTISSLAAPHYKKRFVKVVDVLTK